MRHLVSWPTGTVTLPLWVDRPRPRPLPPDLAARWRRALDAWEAPSPVQEALERLGQTETRVVVAGQQPGPWGGSLYSTYKAATAVALALALAREEGVPTTAVFWVQGDDTDWGEVGWVALPRPSLEVYRHRWEPAPVAPRTWVGEARLPLPDEMGPIVEAWGPSAKGALPDGGTRDLSDHFIGYLLHRFGSHGLVPLDARWPEVRAEGGKLWARYLPRHLELAQAVLARGKTLREMGLPAPLDAAAADHGLFPLDGTRRLPIVSERWEDQVRGFLDRGQPERLAPSVLLRAVLQDHLLGTAAQVTGVTEAAYLEQLSPVYEALEVPIPTRPPRLRATVAPPGILPLEEASRIILDPGAWVSERSAELVPPQAWKTLADLSERLDRDLDSLIESTADFSKDFRQNAESTRRKLRTQVTRLHDSLARRGRQMLYTQEPELRHLAEFLRPRHQEQDRGLSGGTLDLVLGERAGLAVHDAARLHVERLLAGEIHHFCLEGSGD